jgi:hypothetical protein
MHYCGCICLLNNNSGVVRQRDSLGFSVVNFSIKYIFVPNYISIC